MGLQRKFNRIKKKLRARYADSATLTANLNKEFLKNALGFRACVPKAYGPAIDYAARIASQVGLNPAHAIIIGKLKEPDRIIEKAVGKYNGLLESVQDVGRLRILIEKPEDVVAIRKMLLQKKQPYDKSDGRKGKLADRNPCNKITLTEFEDYFREPSSTGRVAIHLNMKVSISGSRFVPFEIQIIHKDMVATEAFTHDNYEKAEAISRQAKAESRKMTAQEKATCETYRNLNRKRYLTDVDNLNLVQLMAPKPQKSVQHALRARPGPVGENQLPASELHAA